MIGWEFPPFMAGGLGVHCLELTRSLAHLGVHIDFYMPAVEGRGGPLRIRDQHHHLDIHEVPAEAEMGPYGRELETYGRDFHRAVMTYNARVVETFASHEADVLHCHDWITVPAALELRRQTGKPLVFTVHSTEYDRSAGLFCHQWIEDIERAGVHEADTVIAVSQYTRNIIMQRYDADPDKIVPIHNGIDPRRFRSAEQRDYRQRRGTVLFLSRLSRQKGPLHFLETARRVLQVRPQTGFVMAGQGDMLAECIDFTIRHGIADRVRFAGYVPADQLATMYDEHEVYVLPSVSEPFGISALEAMATGLPTIVSKASGIAEGALHVLKADHHDVDEMADLILSLLEHDALREEIGRRAGQEARRFDWGTCARRTKSTYETILEVNP